MKSLTWLASFPKSGNTWVRAFLTAYHTNVSGTFDFKRMDEFTTSESYLRDFAAIAGKPREELTEDVIDSLRGEIQRRMTMRKAVPFWIKTHNANTARNGRRLICPEHTKSAIYLVRNPLDVVDSLADQNNQTIDQTIALLNDQGHCLGGPNSKLARQYLGSWSQHVRSWTSEREFPVLVLRYEDLHDSCYASFQQLVEFLGWEVSEERIRNAIECTAFGKMQQLESEKGFAERNPAARSGRFFRRGKHRAWESALTPQQIETVIRHHSEVMSLMGYGQS